MFRSALVFAAFACLLQNGSPLKCYMCIDSEQRSGNYISNCSNTPKNLWNVTDCSAAPHLDRCMVHRLTDRKNGVKVTFERRYCISAARCAFYWLGCQGTKKYAPSMMPCDVGCCKDNLCNEKPEPPKYEFFKPSGKNLSCYTCSDFPRGTSLAGSPVYPTPRNCTSPVKQKCGNFSLQPLFMQDRCITLKVKAIVPSAGNEVLDWTYRGCSSIYHCSFTEALWRYELNRTSEEDRTGISYLSGKSSCCHGNLCNSTTDGDDNSVHSAAAITKVEHFSTGFLCFVIIAIIKARIQ